MKGRFPGALARLNLVDGLVIAVGIAAIAFAWPGFATHDTIFMTAEAERGAYTTYHPLLNALLIRALAVPFDSYAPLMVLQAGVCVALFARALRLAAYGRAAWAQWASVLLWASSVPTVLYLGIIWKDIPMAYGLLFVAALAYRMRSDGVFRATRLDVALLFLSLVATTTLRHGSAFNFLLVPLLLGVASVRRDRRMVVAWAGALVVWLAMGLAARSPLVSNDEAHFTKLKVGAVSQPFLGIVTNRNGYASDDYTYDDMLARKAFGDAYVAQYSADYFRNEVRNLPPDDLKETYDAIVRRTPRLCAMNVSLCLADRFQMLLGTLQPSTRFGGMTFYDLGSVKHCGSTFGTTPELCDIAWRYGASERGAAAELVRRVQARVSDSRGGFTTLYAWNLLPALALVAGFLVLLPRGSALWAASLFMAAQMLLPFATAMANDFRYYYFLALFFSMFAPSAVHRVLQWLARWRAPVEGIAR